MKKQTQLQKKGLKRARASGDLAVDRKTSAKKLQYKDWKKNPAAGDLATPSGRYAGVDNKAAPARYGKGHKRLNPGVSSAPRKRKAVAVVMPSGRVAVVKARKPMTAKQLENLAFWRTQRSIMSKANRGNMGAGYGLGEIDGIRVAGPAGRPDAPVVAKLAASATQPANPYDMSMSGSGFNEATRTGNPYLSGL